MSDIHVRHAEPHDAAAVSAIYAGENACAQTLQTPFPPAKRWQQRLENVPEHVTALVAELNGKVVGNLGMEQMTRPRRKHVATLGMGVLDSCQGKGVGSALLGAALELADNWLNVRRIELTVYKDNQSAIALYKKFGFEVEGEAKDFAFRGGRYVDVLYMSRIRHTPYD